MQETVSDSRQILVAYSGEKGSQVSSILTVANQLEKFVKRPDKYSKVTCKL